MYGVLMLLPQSSAFAALKNRLNSVSAIGYLHIAPRTYVSSHVRQKSTEAKFGSSSGPASSSAGFDRPNRLKQREDGIIRWTELLDKFRSVQDRARRANRPQPHGDEAPPMPPTSGFDGPREKTLPDLPRPPVRPTSAEGMAKPVAVGPAAPPQAPGHKAKTSLGHLSRFAGNVGGRKGKK